MAPTAVSFTGYPLGSTAIGRANRHAHAQLTQDFIPGERIYQAADLYQHHGGLWRL